MAQQGVIIRGKPNTFISDEYLKKARTHNTSAIGTAIVDEDGLLVSKDMMSEVDDDFIRATQKEYKDKEVIFFLCKSEPATNLEDVSPHTILEADEEPALIAFVEGTFSNEKKDSSHPPEYHFIQDVVIPRFEALAELVNGDLDKIMAYIEKPVFKKEILQSAVSRAAITFMASNGKTITFTQGEGPTEFPWGWVSKSYDYSENAEAELVAAEEPKKKVVLKRSTVREPAVPQSSNVEKVIEKVATFTKTDLYTVIKWAPKAGLSAKERKREYQRKLGYCPTGWKQGIEIEVYRDQHGNVLNLSDCKRLGLGAVALPPLHNPPRGKNTEPDHVESKDTLPVTTKSLNDRGPAVTTEVLPVMPPKSREFLRDIIKREDVKKLIAENATVVSDPTVVQAIEKKFADFGTQLGMKDGIFDFMKLDYAWHMKMAEDKHAIANYAWNLRNMALALWINKTKAQEPVVVEGPVVEEPVKKKVVVRRSA